MTSSDSYLAAETAPRFAALIAWLADLPLDDPAWQALPDQIAALQRLLEKHDVDLVAQAAAESAQRAQRTQVADALDRLAAAPAALLTFFGLEHTAQWRADDIPGDGLAEAAASITALGDAVLDYARLQTASLASLHARRTLQTQMETLENQIETVAQTAAGLFGAPQPAAAGAAADESEPDARTQVVESVTRSDDSCATAPEQQDDAESAAVAPAEEQTRLTSCAGDDAEAADEHRSVTVPDELPGPENVDAEAGVAPAVALPVSVTNIEGVLPASAEDQPDVADAAAKDGSAQLAQPVDEAVAAPAGRDDRAEHGEDAAGILEVVQPELGVDDNHAPSGLEDMAIGEDESGIDVEDVVWPAGPAPRVYPPVSEISAADWDIFIHACIANGDLPTAYWTARALAESPQPIPTPVAHWQLAALQGAWWLNSVRGVLVQDLMQIVYGYTLEESAGVQALAIATALKPALVEPETGLIGWLRVQPWLPPAFASIVEAVSRVAAYNRPLLNVDVDAVRGENRHAQAIDEVVNEARRWVEEEPLRQAAFKRASDVWRAWTAPEGYLRRIIDIVASGDSSGARQAKLFVDEWQHNGTIALIAQTEREHFRRVPDRKSRAIDGGPRNWLMVQAEESLELARRWCTLVGESRQQHDWFAGQVEALYHTIAGARTDADIELTEMEMSGNGTVAPSMVRCLRWALHDLCGFFHLAMTDPPPPRRGIDFPRAVPQSLDAGLRFRLLQIPDGAIADGYTAETIPAQTATALHGFAATQPTLAEVIDYHLQTFDLRFVETLCTNLPPVEQGVYLDRLQSAREIAQSILEREVRVAGDAVEQAYVDGLVDIGQRSAFANRIEAVRVDQTPNYIAHHLVLEEIRDELSDQRKSHLRHQSESWSKVHQRLVQAGLPQQDAELYDHIVAMMNDQLARQDIIVVDQRLARLSDILDQGQLPSKAEFVQSPSRSIYREFAEILRDWEDREGRGDVLNQIRQQLRRGELPGLLRLGGLPRPRVVEVTSALDAWGNLKRVRPGSDAQQVRSYVEALLRYIGFLWVGGDKQTLKLEREGGDWAYLQAPITSGNLSPVPQFGTLHGDRFDVVCLWERPEKEVIGSRLVNLRLNANNVIVIYLGRLTYRRRLQLAQYMRQEQMPMLVLDEYLLMFLAREPARLPAFFRCALPLTCVNPYVETGPVAPEMFKGRSRELAALKSEGGYALVYGGRQLGKSALLQQVEREFHDPQAEHYVVRAEIQHVGDPRSQQADPELIWQRLKDGLEKVGLIPKTSATKPATIMEQVAQAMAERTDRRVLVLFDEADNFLAADQQRNFEIVSMLRTLMDNTNRRFKVIFAGLHNVQRYEGVPNQPFAHLPSLEIGPLDPLAARRLIVEPLEALGFRFGKSQAAVLGILAYTNSHPGLIQLFCQHLLKVLYERRPKHVGPVIITRQDVEKVYRRRDVQDGIRRRFEYTIGLDPRYKALAEIMVVEQLEERDGFAHAYSASELRELGQSYWSQAFDATPLDEFRGYLNEMVGLGVLVRTERNEYRLSSPNLVRLMGAAEDIKASLAELTQRAPTAQLMPDSHHAPLDEKARRYSPFTFAQSRALNARQYGVGLIFGSEALGIDLANDAIRKHFVPSGAVGKVHEVRIAAGTGDAFRRWLKRLADDTPDDVERVITHRTMRVPKESMVEQVEAALEFCQRRRHSQRQWMRILMVFDTVATYEWLHLPAALRESLEQQADATVVLRPWDTVGISQRLQQHNKLESDKVMQRIRHDLGGWTWLLDRLLDKWEHGDDPLPAVESVAASLSDKALRGQFLAACGLDTSTKVRALFEFIAQESSPVPQELIAPLLEGQLTADECVHGTEFLRRMGLVVETTDAANAYWEADPVVKRLLATS